MYRLGDATRLRQLGLDWLGYPPLSAGITQSD